MISPAYTLRHGFFDVRIERDIVFSRSSTIPSRDNVSAQSLHRLERCWLRCTQHVVADKLLEQRLEQRERARVPTTSREAR